jgi:4-amino-4-deoxy-L-arabinose transferase-like glycosyltransferase
VHDNLLLTRVRRLSPLHGLLVLAVLLRTGTWWLPHALPGVLEYDDGVYYGSARLLLDGLWPYQDFTIVHPPVLAVVLLPSALVGRVLGDPVGMATARVFMQVVAVANVLLVHRLAQHLPVREDRRSRTALCAAAVYCVMPNAVVAEHTVLLEPLVNLACLSGAYLLIRREASRAGAFAAGFLFVAGLGIKLFAGAYVVAALVWLLWRRQARTAVALCAGLAAGAAVLLAPFAVRAPSALWHDVVVTQVLRPENAGVDRGLSRLTSMVGLGYAGPWVGTLVIVALLAAALAPLGRRVLRSPVLLWLTVLGVSAAAILQGPTYFLHYGDFLAPPVAMLVALVAGTRSGRLDRLRTPLLAGVLLAFAVGTGADLLDQKSHPDLGAVGATIPAGSCVYYDAVSLAIAADVFRPPSSECPSWVDGRGTALTENTSWPRGVDFYPEGFLADSRWQTATVAQMASADYLLLRHSPGTFPEWTVPTRAYALAHFDRAWVSAPGQQHAELWKRKGS